MGFILSVIIAYLLGSISCSIILAKLLKLQDPRSQGSGNAGATNMWRLAGKQAAIYVLVGDALKGLIAVLIARLFHVSGIGLGFIAFIVVIGHVFPLYFKFRGGKGVATALGAVVALSFWVALFLVIVWLIVAVISRYVSIASMITAIAAPIFMFLSTHPSYGFPVLLTAILIIWMHRENINRLSNGTEGKMKF